MKGHPFQRLSSPARSLSLVWHALGVASFGYSFHFLSNWQTPITNSYGWHFQFLTIIGLTASLLAFASALLADITLNSTLAGVKNTISVIATPLEVVISILYWGITAIDSKLIVPPEFEIPLHVDVGFHFAPAVFLVLDHLLFSPPWGLSTFGVMTCSTLVGFAYWYWVELCFSHNGWYVYPMFALLSTSQRALLFVVSASLVTVSSSTLKWIYAKLNGDVLRVHWPANKNKSKKTN